MLKKTLRLLLGNYSIYHVYSIRKSDFPSTPVNQGEYRVNPVSKEQMEKCEDELISEQTWYFGNECRAFGVFDNSRILGVCFFWFGDLYKTRGFLDLSKSEAKLVQIITLPEFRGKGLATRLISSASSEMMGMGFDTLYARIWHSNEPSLRAFQKSGWSYLNTIIEIFPLGRKLRLRIRLRGTALT